MHLEPSMTNRDLEVRYRGCHDPVERSHWHLRWLLARGMTTTAVARMTGYSAYWIGQIAHRYNRDGPEGVRDRCHIAKSRPHILLPEDEHAELRTALAKPHSAGDRWCGRTVASWIGKRIGRSVCR
jgi:hypothetical protein